MRLAGGGFHRIAVFLLLAWPGGMAWAQTTQPESAPKQAPRSAVGSPSSGGANAATSVTQAKAMPVVGLDVRGSDQKLAGRTTNVVVSPDGRAVQLIAQLGGVVTAGGKEVPLDWHQVRINSSQRQVYSMLSKDQLDARPGFRTIAPVPSSRSVPEAANTPVVGLEVHSSDGQKVGSVRNVIVSPKGKVEKLLVTYGSTLGAGGKQVAVPWKDVQVDAAKHVVRVAQSTKQLKNSPAYWINQPQGSTTSP